MRYLTQRGPGGRGPGGMSAAARERYTRGGTTGHERSGARERRGVSPAAGPTGPRAAGPAPGRRGAAGRAGPAGPEAELLASPGGGSLLLWKRRRWLRRGGELWTGGSNRHEIRDCPSSALGSVARGGECPARQAGTPLRALARGGG